VAAARLQLVYINSIRGANRLWGESSVGRDVHGAKRPWGETSMGRNVLPWYEMSVGRTVHKSCSRELSLLGAKVHTGNFHSEDRKYRGAKSPDTETKRQTTTMF